MSAQNVGELSLREKVGQLFMVGFDGTEPTDDVCALIEEYNLGGVIYFSRNIESPSQVASLSRTLQELAQSTGAGSPLLIATDQEGGVVSRLDWGSQLPSHMLFGACGDPHVTRKAGQAVGRELRSLGITMNLAPVLDVNNNPDNPVIGVRSFGESPELVADLGVEMATGMQSADVLACGKHFPGHGDTATDSHVGLPVVDHDIDRLDRVEFFPFKRAIAAGIDAIMTTHVSFPSITDDEDRPATISPAVQTGILRERLDFDGLVVTDCLEMHAIADGVGTTDGAVEAIEAGCDIAMVSHTPDRQRNAIEAVVEAVESGRLSEASIDESVRRIQRLKQERNVAEPPAQSWEESATTSTSIARSVAECGLTLVRDERGVIPFDVDRPLHAIGFTGDRGSNAEDDRYEPAVVFDALEERGVDVRRETVSDPASFDYPTDGTAQILVVTYDARSNPGQATALRRLCAQSDDVAVLAVRTPYDLTVCPDDVPFLTSYGYSPGAVDAAASVLVGDSTPKGTLPVTMPDD
ncbi:beta-N-acetylhexosaminidase [Halorhabdus sp. CUG00001]|uniref:beta-N-acetylhexosaminidase n=1 Tax=Halorhabdus sp. CUG00001 TaxID=2600297 RepID=UPI00131B2FDF|nr:beta-N-acetylhexosaminidase [Halorhabdus sp. CUG00001]